MTYRADQFIDAIKGSGGVISTISERVGCAWNTAKKYISDHPTVSQAYEDECERVADLAESVIVGNIQLMRHAQRQGEIVNTGDAKWWLSKKRKQTFGDAIDIVSDNVLTIRYVNDWRDGDNITPTTSGTDSG